MTPPRKLHIKSYGCQMNVYDSHRYALLAGCRTWTRAGAGDEAIVPLGRSLSGEKIVGVGLLNRKRSPLLAALHWAGHYDPTLAAAPQFVTAPQIWK